MSEVLPSIQHTQKQSCNNDMQGTKACLGWERVPDGGLHSCTAVIDAWLRLLQRALHAVRALRVAVPAAPEYMTQGCGGILTSRMRSLEMRTSHSLHMPQLCDCSMHWIYQMQQLTPGFHRMLAP